MNLDRSRAWDTVERLANATIAALPRLLLAPVAVALFWLGARAVRALIGRYAARRGEHYALEQALGRLAQAAIIVLGLLIGTSIAFPTFSPAWRRRGTDRRTASTVQHTNGDEESGASRFGTRRSRLLAAVRGAAANGRGGRVRVDQNGISSLPSSVAIGT